MRSTKYRTNDIAKEAGLSPATVSRAINHPELVKESTREKIRKVMAAMGYKVEEIFANGGSGSAAQQVLLINVPAGANPFYEKVIEGAFSSASNHGFQIVLNYAELNAATIGDFVGLIKTSQIRGVITLAQLPVEILNAIESIVPVVQCCEFNEDSSLPYVSIDDFKAAENAVRYLLSAGRRRIALMNGPRGFKYSRLRLAGFKHALEEAGIEIPRQWIVHVPEIDYQMAEAQAARLFSGDIIPDAVFAASDVLAAAVINYAIEKGLTVPKDVMIIGFDNILLCKIVRPNLTTVRQPKHELGFTASEMLIERIRGRPLTQSQVILPTELIVRKSTGI